MFVYDLLPRHELEARSTKQGRVYSTPVGDLRSVTTILGEKLKSKKLQEWRDAIGHAEADGITEQARNRGNSVHDACEQYLKGSWGHLHPIGNGFGRIEMMPSNLDLFLRVKPILDKHVTTVFGVEFPLYSETLRTAGRTDGLVEWTGRNVVLDFKTCRRRFQKNDDRIFKYNLQVTTYAMMTEENYNIDFPYNVLILLPSDDEPQIIIKTNAKYRPIVRELFL